MTRVGLPFAKYGAIAATSSAPIGKSQRGVAALDADQLGELEQPVHDVTLASRGQLVVREQPLLIARACAVEADPQRRADE